MAGKLFHKTIELVGGDIQITTSSINPIDHPEALITLHGRRSKDGLDDSVVVTVSLLKLADLYREVGNAHNTLRRNRTEAMLEKRSGVGE